MMGDLLLGQLMDGGQWQAVLAPTSTGKARLLLQVRLNDFTLDFSAPRQGVAQVAGEATLVDAQNYQVLGQQRFAFRAPAIPANSDGGALAMTQVSRAFAKAVGQWAEQVARHSMPG
jgi:cholesterol transport system auxiliary component